MKQFPIIDSHTHILFSDVRSHEFCLRLDGVSYQEIASSGGGINSTIKDCKSSSDEQLLKNSMGRLRAALRLGVTTLEVKSGYGMSLHEEIRHLQLLNELQQKTSQHLEVTCLALHALPPDASSTTQFVKTMTSELLPEVKKQNFRQEQL